MFYWSVQKLHVLDEKIVRMRHTVAKDHVSEHMVFLSAFSWVKKVDQEDGSYARSWMVSVLKS